jgi:hypothetical protein
LAWSISREEIINAQPINVQDNNLEFKIAFRGIFLASFG